MRYTAVTSSSISEIGYDSESRVLGVKFRQGEEYEYYDVPRAIHHALLNATSVGALFDRMVKQAGYNFRRIN